MDKLPTIQGIESFKETFCRDKPYRKNSWCCDGQARSLRLLLFWPEPEMQNRHCKGQSDGGTFKWRGNKLYYGTINPIIVIKIQKTQSRAF